MLDILRFLDGCVRAIPGKLSDWIHALLKAARSKSGKINVRNEPDDGHDRRATMLFKWIGAFRGATRRFASSRDANVATIFALACIPLIAAVGIAVDYARVSRAHSHMQDALDATTLALSR